MTEPLTHRTPVGAARQLLDDLGKDSRYGSSRRKRKRRWTGRMVEKPTRKFPTGTIESRRPASRFRVDRRKSTRHACAMARTPSNHDQYQMQYYRSRLDGRRIRPVETPYVLRHFRRVAEAADLDSTTSADRVLEVGCGSGRFTRLLLGLETGPTVVANDLSPELLATLEASTAAGSRLRALAGGVEELPRLLEGQAAADRAVGFFVLHHLFDLKAAFTALGSCLKPGSPVAFCEPSAGCPLFYLQILLTPGMTWRAEKGIRNMTPDRVLSAMEAAGFSDLQARSYGFFPPQLSNRPMGRNVERRLEAMPWLKPVRAFQVFSGRC